MLRQQGSMAQAINEQLKSAAYWQHVQQQNQAQAILEHQLRQELLRQEHQLRQMYGDLSAAEWDAVYALAQYTNGDLHHAFMQMQMINAQYAPTSLSSAEVRDIMIGLGNFGRIAKDIGIVLRY